MGWPSRGVKSILKSPVWRMTPRGVVMARATAPGILWLVLMNSTLKQPSSTVSPGFTT